MAVGSAEDGFDAGGEFARAERFDEVIVAADFEGRRHGRFHWHGLSER